MRRSLKARADASRGQVLALSCVLLFVMAMTMILSFNLTQGIHEKIRLQSHSDSVAYSVAAVEARAFNYLAYTNRAIAAGLVAQMGLHAWMSTASAAAATLEAGMIAFGMISALEFIAAGFCPYPPFVCCIQPQHCPHSIEAGIVAIRMMMEAMDVADKVQGHDSDFNDAVADLKAMVDQMHKDQREVLDTAQKMLTTVVPERLKMVNAPTSKLVDELKGLNSTAFACSLEGSNFDDDCTTRAKADPAVRSIVLENSANSARTVYHRTIIVGVGMDAHEDFRTNSDYLKKLQNNRGEVLVVRFGNAHTGEGYEMDSDNGDKVESVGAYQTVIYTVPTWYDIPGVGGSLAKIFSDENGGTHSIGFLKSDSDHDQFLGAQKSDVCGDDENCFIHFRATDDKKSDFGQPTAYGGARQDLRTRPGTSDNKWEVNSKATLKVELVQGDAMELKLAARTDALAVSKAKAYFHQPGNWKAPPNFFDPFWRAKLHPFGRDELIELLQNVGASADAEMAGALPVEGDTR